MSSADAPLPVLANREQIDFANPAEEPGTEATIAKEMVVRGLVLAPPVIGLCWLFGDEAIAASVGYGMAIIMVNFLLSAYFLAAAARISLGLVASVALGGYATRLALVFVAVWVIKDASWVRFVPLGVSIIATHLGLLVCELGRISATVTYPGVKPKRKGKANGSNSRPAAGHRPDRYRHPSSLSE